MAGGREVVAVVTTPGPWAWAPSSQVQWPVAHGCLSNFGIVGVGDLVTREEGDEKEKEKARRKGGEGKAKGRRGGVNKLFYVDHTNQNLYPKPQKHMLPSLPREVWNSAPQGQLVTQISVCKRSYIEFLAGDFQQNQEALADTGQLRFGGAPGPHLQGLPPVCMYPVGGDA